MNCASASYDGTAPKGHTKQWLLVAILIATMCGLQSSIPLRTAVKIGADEDWELSKAVLALNGFRFYTEVWNDQPLLHTSIITNVLKHLSPSVLSARLVTSAFSIVLLTGVFFIALRVGGLLVAGLASALLMVSPGFLELSSSCMVEIPALAPAIAGLAVLMGRRTGKIPPLPRPSTPREGGSVASALRHPKLGAEVPPSPQPLSPRRGGWLRPVIAGVLFGISFQIKFINVILLPLVVLIVWLRGRESQDYQRPPHPNASASLFPEASPAAPAERRLVRPLLFFGGSLFATFVVIAFAMGAEGYWIQLKLSWSAHFAATKSFEYGSPNDHPFEWTTYLKNWDTTIPAVIGIVFCFLNRRKNPWLVLPLAWFFLELVVLGIHTPWWSYYYIHNAVPLCFCAAIGIAAVVRWLRQRRNIATAGLAGVCGLLMAGWMSSRVYLQISKIRSSPQIYSSLVLKEIERYKPFTKFIYTDEPAYSFHAGIPMPPALAVITLKRLWSGDMTNARLVEELRLSKPGVLLLKNQTTELPFSDWMNTEYRLVYQDEKHNLYVHKSIVGKVRW